MNWAWPPARCGGTTSRPARVSAPADDLGRSAQTFMIDVEVTSGGQRRRASASGRDIYAVSAPLVAGAIGSSTGRPTVWSRRLDPVAFPRSLEPVHLTFSVGTVASLERL